jgi:hypothetical protein
MVCLCIDPHTAVLLQHLCRLRNNLCCCSTVQTLPADTHPSTNHNSLSAHMCCTHCIRHSPHTTPQQPSTGRCCWNVERNQNQLFGPLCPTAGLGWRSSSRTLPTDYNQTSMASTNPAIHRPARLRPWLHALRIRRRHAGVRAALQKLLLCSAAGSAGLWSSRRRRNSMVTNSICVLSPAQESILAAFAYAQCSPATPRLTKHLGQEKQDCQGSMELCSTTIHTRASKHGVCM